MIGSYSGIKKYFFLTVPIGGILNILPMTGILLKKLIATGKKPLK